MKPLALLVFLLSFPLSAAAGGLPELDSPKTGRTASKDVAVVIGVDKSHALAAAPFAEREAARELDRATLSKLLPLEVVPAQSKRTWALEFVDAYGMQGNPHVSALRPGLPVDRMPVDVAIGIDWVRLDGGAFSMGSTDGGYYARPVHPVRVSAFELARSEVTVAQYRACVERGPCTAPDTGAHCNWGKADRDDHPVNCVDWEQAKTFCGWIGARLPTEAEWEYAARSGGRDITHPWGNESPDCSRCVMDDGGNGCGQSRTWPVCSKPHGSSAQGICDLAGNVWEAVEDCWHGSYLGAPADGLAWTEDCTGSLRVMRGGCWARGDGFLSAASRRGISPVLRHDGLGIRPARSAP